MVAWLYLPSHGNQNQDLAPSEMNLLLSDLLQMEMIPIRPGIHKIYTDVLQALKLTIQNEHAADNMRTPLHNLVELSTLSNPTRRISLNDQIAILQETEDTTLEDVNQALGLDLPSNIQPIQAMIYVIIRKEFQSNFPKVHGLGYVDFLLDNLKEFQGRYSNSLALVKNQLQIIEKKLESLQPFLKAVAEEPHNKLKILQDCAIQLTSKAYEVEYVVNVCTSKEVPHWFLELWLLDITKEITHIKAKVAEIPKKQVFKVEHDTLYTSTVHTLSQSARNRNVIEEIVGFEDVTEELRRRLTKESKELDVISIVGMPGLGKTTLAYKLYSDKSVISHFDIRAQCCVSQVYTRKDLLLAILLDATGESPTLSTEADVAEKLRRSLLPKRYLILVDDVWGSSAWDDIKCCFHDANNGSRIILTTRHLEVANHAKSVSNPLHLRMLNDDESWKLLQDKVFGKENCFPPLEEVGQQIARKCGGLPLSIVLVAGILAKMEKKEESWKQVAMTLGSHIHSDSKAIVELSYRDLPSHLKPCFLYFGTFLEDRAIDASTLMRLWISEAFINKCEGKSLEDIAEGYLENLIGRNLVMVAQRAYSDDKVEACRLHDVLLDFCKTRATEENFLLWMKQDQHISLSSCKYSHTQHAKHRLVFHQKKTFEEWSSSCSLVGSVILRNTATYSSSYHRYFTISHILQTFKFLKVLDLEFEVVIDSFPTNLAHLRYFAASTQQNSIPSSISNLSNLETLILNSWRCVILPVTLWKMVKLRHVHFSGGGSFVIKNAEELLEDSTKLLDLGTLSTPCFSRVEDAEYMLRKTPNIRELRCKFAGGSSFKFSVLKFPTRLETLHICCPVADFQHEYPVCISALNLKKLTVQCFRLGFEHLSNIAQLQNLQVLELDLVMFEHNRWEVNNDDFPQLKVLKFVNCRDLGEWIVADDAFPNLERFVLSRCTNFFKEIPSCFEDISSLKSIEVENCNESVVESARVIQETQAEDYQNTDFKLIIKESRFSV